jgi:hypothetical protein
MSRGKNFMEEFSEFNWNFDILSWSGRRVKFYFNTGRVYSVAYLYANNWGGGAA